MILEGLPRFPLVAIKSIFLWLNEETQYATGGNPGRIYSENF